MLEKALIGLGVLGFLSVFQLVGISLLHAAITSARTSLRAGKGVKQLPGTAIGIAFALAWTVLPLVGVYQGAGWLLLVPQLAVTGTLVAFVVTPYRHPPDPDTATPATDQGGLRRLFDRRTVEPVTGGRIWRRVGPAVTAFVIGAAYLQALRDSPLPGMTASWLATLVKVEFLVIHSFPFLALITLPRLEWRRWRVFQWFLFTTWFALYLGFAVADEHALGGVLAFVAGTLATYLGFILRRADAARIAALVQRWLASLIVFMASAALTGSQNWQASSETLMHGLIYFTVLGLLELSGVYDLEWKKLFRDRTASPDTGA